MFKSKHIFTIVFALPMLLMVFSISSAQDEVIIDWWHIQTQEERATVYEELATTFEEANPGVDIQITILENEAFKSQIITVMQAGDPPDLFHSWGGGPLWAFAQAGLTRDISEWMDADDGAWRNSFASQGVVDLWGLNGEQYGAPYNFGPVGMWYNKAIVEELGFDPENPYETWDEFLAVIEAAQGAGIAPIAVGESEKWPGHFWFAYLALRLGGGEAYTAAFDRSGSFTDQPFVDSYQYIIDLVDMGAFQEGFLGMGYGDAGGMFERGEAVFHLMGTWDVGFGPDVCDCEPLGENRGWAKFPVIEGGAGNPTDVFGGGDGYAVGANAPDEAIEFLKYLTSAEAQEKQALWTLPTNVEGGDYLADNPYGDAWLDAMAEATVIVSFLDQFYPPALGEAVNDTVETVFAGAATPEEAAQALEDIAAFELE